MVIARRRHSERTESAGHVAPSSAAQPHRPLTLLAREALLSVRDVGSGLCSFVNTEQGRVRYLGGGGASARTRGDYRRIEKAELCWVAGACSRRMNATTRSGEGEEARETDDGGHRGECLTVIRPVSGGSLERRLSDALHINAQLRTQDAQAQTVEKGERQQRQSEVSAGSQEGECDDGL